MIVRNFNDAEMKAKQFVAHGGGKAVMLFDAEFLQGMLFMAEGTLEPGNFIEPHSDPYEEIYYTLEGKGVMTVGDESVNVGPGDAVWIPYGIRHGLKNTGETTMRTLVVAAMPKS